MAIKIGSDRILFNIILNIIHNVFILRLIQSFWALMPGKFTSIDMIYLHVFTFNFQVIIQIKKYHSFIGDAGH